MQHDDYTIALICVLPDELAAARILLTETHKPLPQKASDDNHYTLGNVGPHNIVIACLPTGVYGNVSAAVVTTKLQSTFPCVRFGLLVGIGGGIPSARHDIRLGDVVVSHPEGSTGGVIQYDMGKTVQGAIFRQTGQLNHPPAALLNAVSKLRSDQRLGKRRIDNIMAQWTEQYPGIFVSPGAENDRLFRSDFEHPEGEPTCASCDWSRLVSRPSRDSAKPVVHYGLIASGNQVMRHGPTRDRLGQELGAICFEMEAAGLMDNFPCLVIRGICDYADSHKNKEWQVYAAFTAAAYARELMDLIPSFEVTQTLSANERLDSFQNMVLYRPQQTQRTRVERDAWSMEHYEDPRAWKILVPRISGYDREKAHRRLSQGRVQNTTEWFLQHEYVSRWLNDPSCPSFWCSGGRNILVGTGKTMICTSLVDHLANKSTKKALVYFYCETADSQTLRATYLLRSLIRQVLDIMTEINQNCPREAKQRIGYFYNATGPVPDSDDLTHIFSILHAEAPPIIYIIDGLDEMEQTGLPKVVAMLNSLFKDPAQKLFVACRDELGLNTQLRPALHLQLAPSHTQQEIKSYIEAEISRKTQQERMITDDQQVIQNIKERLIVLAQGMFLWVRLQIEALWLDCFCDEDIQSALSSLPPDINATYDRCVMRIPARSRHMAAKALRWLVCAKRPLHIHELQEAVSFSLSDSQWNRSKITTLNVVFSACANLISMDLVDYSVRLTHHSVRQYLFVTKLPTFSDFQLGQSHLNLLCGEECVSYLSFSDFQLEVQKGANSRTVMVPTPARSLARIPLPGLANKLMRSFVPTPSSSKPFTPVKIPLGAEKAKTFKFLAYARDNWAEHTQNITRTSAVWDKYKDLAMQPNVLWRLHPWAASGQSQSSHLHGLVIWASRNGHLPLLRIAIHESGSNRIGDISNIPSVENGLTALQMVARQGFTAATALLLEVCSVNAVDGESQTALHHCAHKDQAVTARMILSTPGVNVSMQSRSGETALALACRLGFVGMVGLLFQHGATANTLSLIQRDALTATARNGSVEVLDSLFRTSKVLKLHKSAVESLLEVAFQNRHEQIVKLFINTGYNVMDFRGPKGETSLYLAVQYGFVSVVKMLVENPETNHEIGDTTGRLLFCAMDHRHESMFKMLFDFSYPSFLMTNRPFNPLLRQAIDQGLTSTVMFLLDCNAQTPDSTNSKWIELLLDIVLGESDSVMKKLLDITSFNLGALDKLSISTPLSMAAQNGRQEMVEFLLGRDNVDPNSADELGRTPLHWAVVKRHYPIVKVLLTHSNIDANLPDVEGNLPLSCAVGQQDESMVKLLLDHEQRHIDINFSNNTGETALHIAVRIGHKSITKLLLDRSDIDADVKNQYNITPLSLAVEWGHKSIAKLLLDRNDVDVNSENLDGDTPIKRAVWHEDESVAKLLLNRGDVNVNSKDSVGATPLITAVTEKHGSVVKLLLGHKSVNINARNSSLKTSLLIAAECGHKAIVRSLLSRRDIDIDAKDENGKTALQLAKAKGHEAIVDLLEQHKR